MLKDNLIYLREFFKEFETTGTCFPSSKWAADALTKPIDHPHGPLRILEVGPGTGSVTLQILDKMIPGDSLTICEINPRFMRELKIRLSQDERFKANKEAITFFEGAVQDLPETNHFDVIVCALPFLNFEVATVKQIFDKLRRLGTDRTVMSYYEYMGIRLLGKVVAPKERKQRIREFEGFMHGVHYSGGFRRNRVWRNVLPINIYTLELAGLIS